MKLTKEQIQEIESYLIACGVKWYDVRIELVDHFANTLEEKLEENPALRCLRKQLFLCIENLVMKVLKNY